MKSKYTPLWAILALSLAVVTVVSFMDDISIGGRKLKKAPIAEMLTTEQVSAEEEESRHVRRRQEMERKARKLEVKVDSAPQNFLVFGDSMSENLALRLAAYAAQNGHTIHTVNWDSSGTRIWASTDTLDYFIKKYKPTYIFVTLGSNESFAKNVDHYRPYVRALLQKMGRIPFVWIGPPAFKEEHGFNDMLLEELPAGTFFRAHDLELERRKDKIHPTVKAAAYEVDSLARWMRRCAHPILMNLPADSVSRTRIKDISITYLRAKH